MDQNIQQLPADMSSNNTLPEQPTTPPTSQPRAAAGGLVDDDNVATPEEMAAEALRSAEKRAKKKEQAERKESEFAEYVSPDSLIDPYLDPDPNIPWEPYKESIYLSRGCRKCPEAYAPVGCAETRMCSKVTSCDWLEAVSQPEGQKFDIVEVRFKNNRKDFYRLPDGIDVVTGDVVAVEGLPGHDIGIVTLTGEVCRLRMKKKNIDPSSEEIRKLFRRAKAVDIEKWVECLANEHEALIRTRQLANEQGLVMKIDDVEYQGDHSKAIFYYTADERVDFRNLIKVLADEFKVRIEMKQIGVRQEAARVGGLGTCGRELCCSTWLTNFKSVTTSAAKVQQIHPNPQKLAGQCGKLKCCLNYECEVYADALKQFPPTGTSIRFKKGLALYKKIDVLRGIMWYAYEGENDLYAIKAEDAKKLIEMNRNQEYADQLEDYKVELMSTAALVQESSTADFERELQRMADNAPTQQVRPKGDHEPRLSDKSAANSSSRQRNSNPTDRDTYVKNNAANNRPEGGHEHRLSDKNAASNRPEGGRELRLSNKNAANNRPQHSNHAPKGNKPAHEPHNGNVDADRSSNKPHHDSKSHNKSNTSSGTHSPKS